MYFKNPSPNENDLAIIERADTASRAYSAGQYVSWHGRTGRVKADILQGATLSDNLFEYEDGGALSALSSNIFHNVGFTKLYGTLTAVGADSVSISGYKRIILGVLMQQGYWIMNELTIDVPQDNSVIEFDYVPAGTNAKRKFTITKTTCSWNNAYGDTGYALPHVYGVTVKP